MQIWKHIMVLLLMRLKKDFATTTYVQNFMLSSNSGVHLLAVSTRFRPHPFESAAVLCSLSLLLGISESISTAMSACTLT